MCGFNLPLVFNRVDRFRIPSRYGICVRCGHIYQCNPLTEVELDRFYGTNEYRQLYTGGCTPEQHIVKATPKEDKVTPLFELSEKYLSKNGAVLDWGCSGGWNLVPFASRGYRTLGIDVGEDYLKAGRELLGLDLRPINQDTLTAARQFEPDVVLINHVLEHVGDPRITLLQIMGVCTTDTVLVVGLPTLESLPDYGYRNFFTVAHINYFTVCSFSWLASQVGFRVVEWQRTHGGVTFVLKIGYGQEERIRWSEAPRNLLIITRYWLNFRMRTMAKSLLAVIGLDGVFRRTK